MLDKHRLWHGEVKFPLIIVKGICEKHDGAAYFGSLIGYPVWVNEAKKLGLIEGDLRSADLRSADLRSADLRSADEPLRVTPLGLLIYRDGLGLMPRRGRAVEWKWSSELLERARKMIEKDIEEKKPAREQTKEF